MVMDIFLCTNVNTSVGCEEMELSGRVFTSNTMNCLSARGGNKRGFASPLCVLVLEQHIVYKETLFRILLAMSP